MSDSDSLKEQITAATVATLATICPNNGYATDGVEVSRPRRTGEKFAPKDKGILVLQGSCSRRRELDVLSSPAMIGWELEISCDLVLRVSEQSDEPMDRLLNEFEADVMKALAADPKLGGLAVTSELGDSEYPPASAGLEGVTVWFHVFFRTRRTDPRAAV